MDPLKMQLPRKDTGQSINNETDSSDEEDNRAKHRVATGQHNPASAKPKVLQLVSINEVSELDSWNLIVHKDSLKMQPPRKDTGQSINNETDSSDEEDNRAKHRDATGQHIPASAKPKGRGRKQTSAKPKGRGRRQTSAKPKVLQLVSINEVSELDSWNLIVHKGTRDIPVFKSLDISVTKGIRCVKIIETTGCSRSVERTPKAQPFNPESNSSEDSDILDPDETQPKTGIPHPIQETRP